MRFLILNTDYPAFLEWLYASHPGLKGQPYAEQARVRNETMFGVADFYSTNLRRLGHEAWDIYVNNEFAQKAWGREHGVQLEGQRRHFWLRGGFVPWISRTSSWFSEVLSQQVAHYRPDVVLNLAIEAISGRFLKGLKPHMRLLMGQHAAPLPSDEDIRCYDLLLSSLPNQVDHFRRTGVRAELKRLAFEPRILERLKTSPTKTAISFVGSLDPDHQSRLQLLERVCVRPDVELWGPGVSGLPETAWMRRRYKGTAWALDMYQILHNSKITLNHHIDVAEQYANNMRLFEATGVGVLLLTDWKVNLGEMFEPDREVVVYRSPEECAALLDYYLAHDEERDAIARAGQQRTLREHSYFQRMQELVDVVAPNL
jgi:spore maturation protein CgeB